jgi:RNA polymerase sigma-70 factor, ECF subfamily
MFGQTREINPSGACRWGAPPLFATEMDNHPSNLEALLGRVALGDRQAFRALYDASAKRMFDASLRLLGDPALAEDATLEAYLRIWRAADRFDPARGVALAWMGRIVRTASLDRVAADRKRNRIRPIEIAQVQAEPADARVLHCLKALPKPEGKAVILTYAHGLTHAELAAHLDVSLETARSWVECGAESLRACMGRKQ